MKKKYTKLKVYVLKMKEKKEEKSEEKHEEKHKKTLHRSEPVKESSSDTDLSNSGWTLWRVCWRRVRGDG